MSSELIGVLGIVVLFLFMATRMWIGFAMALVGFFGIAVLRGGFAQALNVMGSSPFTTINSYTMTVVPMFLLMGLVISETSIGRGLYRAANAWIGHFRGGLAAATTCASGLLGAICSSHMTGTIIIEQVFTIPGVGRLLLSSISNRDFPVVQAIVVIMAAWIVLVNFAADLLYQLVDPRLRLR